MRIGQGIVMPELPEVETVRKSLSQYTGRTILEVELSRPDLRYPIPAPFAQVLTGSTIKSIHRRAKYLIWDLGEWQMISHLGMTGSWQAFKKGEYQKGDHDHIILSMDDLTLVYRDPRRFGYVDICKSAELEEHNYFRQLGFEPLAKEFTGEWLWSQCRNKLAPIKNVIMDQSVVVGVGNIYASEALFLAGIRPSKRAHTISQKKMVELVEHIKATLKRAIKKGGSTIRDFAPAAGETGYFQISLKVYGKEGEPCPNCATAIKKVNIGNRSSFFCPACQK